MNRPFRILFIGNSYTTRHGMPALLAQLAGHAGVGRQLDIQLAAFGGASLAAHWSKGDAQAMLDRQGWDAVVLQDQSTRPIRALASMQKYGQLFAQAAQAAGSKPFFFATWARANQPESQPLIDAAYEDLARVTGAGLIPVGPAWQHLHRLRPQLLLHDADASHPSFAGAYLTACVCCASLFGKKPQHAEHIAAGMEKDDALLMHRIAWETVTARRHGGESLPSDEES